MSEYSRIKYGHQGTRPLSPSRSYPPLGRRSRLVLPALPAPAPCRPRPPRAPADVCGPGSLVAVHLRHSPQPPHTSSATTRRTRRRRSHSASRAAAGTRQCTLRIHPHFTPQRYHQFSLAHQNIAISSHKVSPSLATHSPLTIHSISQIIPPESLVAVSSHLTPCKKPCPVLFEIHLPYSLDRIAGYPQLSPPHILPIYSVPIPPVPQHKCSSNQLRSSVTGVLNAALNTKISLPPVPSSRSLLSLKRNPKVHAISDGTSECHVADAIPKQEPRHSTPSSTRTIPQPSQSRLPSTLVLPTTYPLHPLSSHM